MPGSDDLERVWRQKVLDELIALVTLLSTGAFVEFPTPQHVIVDSGGGGGGDGAILDGVSSAIKATVFNYTNSKPLGVVLRDTNGDYVSVGGGTQYVNGVAQASPVGTVALGWDGANVRALKTAADGTLAVSGTFFQATQPVSLAAAVDVSDRVARLLGHVTVDNASIAITAAALPLPAGAATEATLALIKAKTDNLDVALSTRAVTGLTDAQLRASAVPVSAAALPLPAGAATEATLATMLTLAGFQARINTLGQKTMVNSTPVVLASDQSAIPVTGTFFQATQPVSGTFWPTAAAAPGSQRLSDGAAFYDAAKTGQLPTALVGARLDINNGAWLGSTAPTVGSKTSANSVPVVIASDQGAVAVTPPTITKGTQGATGFTTQNLKDAGRARVSITFQGVGAIADALLTLVKSTNGTVAAGATTQPVAANKILRITAMTFSVKANAAVAAFATFTLRINPAGVAAIGSQIELRVDLGNTEAVIGAARAITIPVPDGFELSGTTQLAVSAVCQAITNILSVTLTGFEY